METKTCAKCKQEKPMTTEYFGKANNKPNGFQSWCKECKKKDHLKNKEQRNKRSNERYYELNPKEILPKGMKRCSQCNEVKLYEKFNKLKKSKDGYKSHCRECRSKEFKENKERYQEAQKQYYELNKEQINKQTTKYYVNKYQIDRGFRILVICRSRLILALKGKSKSASTKELIGCSTEYLLKHLENQFTEGMRWENYGQWQIDHIKPCALYDFTKEENQRECFNYQNLQPLWAEDNMRKSDKYEEAL